MTVRDLNQTYCESIINQCLACGIHTFCVAPGSRSAPLALAAKRLARVYTHIDERGLGFFALGIAKTQGLVAVICTSGSAVANLIPSAIEAYQSHIDLCYLTADRPSELIAVGANQAIQQPGIMQPNIAGECHLPAPTTKTDIEQALETISQTLAIRGPVHINIALREPLYGDGPIFSQVIQAPSITAKPRLSAAELPPLASKTMLVAGELTVSEAQAVLTLAEHFQLPVIADINSQLGNHPLVLTAAHHIELPRVERILQFGGRIVSKRVNQWLANAWVSSVEEKYNGQRYDLVRSNVHRLDPSGQAIEWHASIEATCQHLADQQPEPALNHPAINQSNAFDQYVDSQAFGELKACKLIATHLPSDWQLMLGNSLTIRLFDQLTTRRHRIISNRGASGIDGLIATACGAAQFAPTLLVVGDMSALYDINSLFLLARQSNAGLSNSELSNSGPSNAGHPIIVVVLNNQGGNIFDMLPASGLSEQSELFTMAQPVSFENLARGFGVNYRRCEDERALLSVLLSAKSNQQSMLVEVVATPFEATSQLKAFRYG
ncbi:2-succinyl-5-enolpyruvyl-6-hydroxy-3-cyclohexene-1-carboxylic-acid synthase [Salinibius halmophilus]|uniref:2-succinyl-5-enolpyruvyl-6-hydroxy-3- cyclohexene-1-carboxylic-acid synthase n=1 Tax=Salinibius halmophilus TaxID=1853216 RepID=UPI000E65FE51|nr:2-succinyl-5-enolpyruvyl-6-hydroxy-3-cyclohexene-1-carboxylic-acid synthase [Salinibius halmophilus]